MNYQYVNRTVFVEKTYKDLQLRISEQEAKEIFNFLSVSGFLSNSLPTLHEIIKGYLDFVSGEDYPIIKGVDN